MGKRTGRPRGRPKGSQTSKTQEIVAKASASGITPLEYMLAVLQDEDAAEARRDDMAKAAAPYMHPKLANLQHSGPDGGAINVKIIAFGSDPSK